MSRPVIHWFRNDLRLRDNPSLSQAARRGDVLAVYIHDESIQESRSMGAASKVWLHHALKALDHTLKGRLLIFQGDPRAILFDLIEKHGVKDVFWNRCFEPWQIKRDTAIKKELEETGVTVVSNNAYLLWQPWEVLKQDGSPYKVFTPFYRRGCLSKNSPRSPLEMVEVDHFIDLEKSKNQVEHLSLLPENPWHEEMVNHWKISEAGAQSAADYFFKNGIQDYKQGRDFPSEEYISRLSPYLHFGQISVHELWHRAKDLGDDSNIDHFCSELGWREFAYNLLFYNTSLQSKNLVKKFDHFPWREDESLLKAWQQGQTGIPMVDAGMRELWQTGFMHNRCRMIVASFLIKNLLIDWRRGEEWFWDCLVDADLASNSSSWQWVAGCGTDASPFFRIFNPLTQGQKFDSEGGYIRKYLPELSKLPNKYLFAPWEAPQEILQHCGIELGRDYPYPIVDLKASRSRALEALKMLGS